MPKSCFDGYLTDKCKDCPDWRDGKYGDGVGCYTKYPIMLCPYFKEMYERGTENGCDESSCPEEG